MVSVCYCRDLRIIALPSVCLHLINKKNNCERGLSFSTSRVFGSVMSVSTAIQLSDPISVSVNAFPVEEESDPSRNLFAFKYDVRIENFSSDTVQLLERHWIIESAENRVGEVIGSGVVGLQPFLEPGQHFEYSSSVTIRDPVGGMRGTYIFNRLGSGLMGVEIPRFSLVYLSVCN